MKNAYKILATVIALVFSINILSASIYAKGVDNEYGGTATVTLNEYELASQLAKESESSLQKRGLSTSEIKEIKNYKEVYRKHIESLNLLDDNALLANGYTIEQVKIIRNFGGSESEMQRLGATLSLSASTSNFSFDGDYTRGKLSYSWSWNSVPAFKLKDMVAVSWNGWAVTSKSSNVKYYNVNTGAYYTQESATFTQDGNGVQGAAHKFNVSKSDNYYYAKKGSGSFTIRSDTHAKKDFYYYIAYGHSQLVASISFSVGIGGGDGSITFSVGTVIAASKTGQKIMT